MLFDKEKSKINKGKKDQNYNTETMLPITDIHHDTIVMKDGGLRGIIRVDGLNLDLKNDDEIGMAIEQFKKMLNGLQFPIQILIRNTSIDLTPYISYMNQNIDAIDHPTLRKQAEHYRSFLDQIQLKSSMIFVKEFFIIVPLYSAMIGDEDGVKTPWRVKMLRVFDAKEGAEKIVAKYRTFLKQKKDLDSRCSLIISSIQGLGTNAKRVVGSDLVSLLFTQYNPTLQQSQSIKKTDYSPL
ncbi:MAG: hypothetical protein NZL83_01855 [Candidatus Absconditabacterales bacterium]|nr:hypothetical protein [Candidatus Absconditabacterales bacterium]